MSVSHAFEAQFLAEVLLLTEADTVALGARLAEVLAPGDILLLDGDLGAGKTFLARAVIQSLQAKDGRIEDVPSPTYTLVQTYEAGGAELWHADLYRLSHPDELWELGFDSALGEAIVVVEWPERAADAWPQSALWLRMEAQDAGRKVTLCGDPKAARAQVIAKAVVGG